MRKLLVIAMLLTFGWVVSANAEDLGELAKKEKARRQQAAKQGKKPKTYSNTDVDRLKAEEAGAVQVMPETSPPAGDPTASEPAVTEQTTDAQETQAEETATTSEPGTAASVENDRIQSDIDALTSQKAALQIKADEARKAIAAGGGYHTATIGNRYAEATDAENRIAEIDAKIAELEAQKRTE